MKVTDCPMRGCGLAVGITQPIPERGRRHPILRTSPHRRPDGTRCTPTQVDPAALREVDEAEHRRARKARAAAAARAAAGG